MKSYTSQKLGFFAAVAEAKKLYLERGTNVSASVGQSLLRIKEVEDEMGKRFGVGVNGLKILDLGAGQFLTQMHYFALRNQVVGVDVDVIPQGFDIMAYFRMVRSNGPRRAIKTIGRKLLGVDRCYQRELRRYLKVNRLPRLLVYEMDATNLGFADSSFDFVFCRSVFHHLPQPQGALEQIRRVLKPGGIAYVDLHLYSSQNGSLQVNVVKDTHGGVVKWPHLRPEFRDQVASNAFLNRLRLDEWRRLFTEAWPGTQVETGLSSRIEIAEEAKTLLQRAEITGYSLEELVAHDVRVFWQKSSSPLSAASR